MSRITEFLTSIRQVVRLHDSMLKPVCDHHQLSAIETTIISFLYNNPGKDTAADIVQLRMLSKGNVSQAVESLIQKSLLARRQDQADRRKIHLSLTKEARPVTEEIEEIQKEFRKTLFQGFSPEEQKLFFEWNGRIQENARSAMKRGESLHE